MRLSDTFNSEGNLLLKMCFSLGLSDPDLWPADFNLCQVKVLYCFHVNGLDAGTDVQRKKPKDCIRPTGFTTNVSQSEADINWNRG